MGNNIAQRSKPSWNSLAQGSSVSTNANLVRVGGWAVPSFTAPLAETKHERSVILLRLNIYTLRTPLCTCLRALNRKGCVNLMYFSFAYH